MKSPHCHRDWRDLGSKMLLTIEVPESSTSSSEIQEQTNTDDTKDVTEKTNLAKKMLEVCRGIPLFIVVLGGILRKKQTLDGWKSVLRNITSHLRAGHDHGRSCMEILLQSYNDLPYYLKPCCLHLANFPEDYEISTQSLYQMWVAEGLVTWSMRGRTTGTRCLEDVANDYLNGLAQVGLVEIVDATSEGWINSIRMHDLVRDVCDEKATTDNVLKTIDLHSGRNQQLNTSDYCSVKRLLRMAIYLPDGSIESFIGDYLSSKAPKYLRSLVLFPSGCGPPSPECQQLMTSICSEFQLLRVLVVGNIELGHKLTSQVENLIHLWYLSLASTFVIELPSCIGKLQFLEILDLQVQDFGSPLLIVPNTLWKLFRLRRLLFPEHGYKIKGSEMLRVDTLTCLEVIENLVVKNLEMKGMRKIKNLRQLSIVKGTPMSRKEAEDIIVAIGSNCSQRFFLEIEGNAISEEEPMLLSSITFHVELEISGKIQCGNLGQLPQYLEKLTLSGCHIKDDPMGILGCLHHLKSLTFNKGSYAETKLSCPPKSFPLLESLSFIRLEVLEEWELGSGSMPKLNSLVIDLCNKLMRIPCVLPLSLQEMKVNLAYGLAGRWLKGELLDGESADIVLLGKGGEDMVVYALEYYFYRRDVALHFDAIARTRVPGRRSCRAGGGLLPRGSLQKLLRDLRDPKQSREGQDLSRMSSHDLLTELQQLMQQRRCLVIAVILEVDVEHVQADLENTFGNPWSYGKRGSKLLIILESDTETPLPAKECQLQRSTSTQILYDLMTYEEKETNAGNKWNRVGSCLRQGLSLYMYRELLERDEFITKWATEQEKLIDSSPIEPSPIFTLYYKDLLKPYLRHCLIYLANFPEEVEISTKKLHQMWIADGIVGSNQEGVLMEESLENLADSYLNELKGRSIVTAPKMGPDKRPKTCQLKLGLRDLCLAKAEEEHKLQNLLNLAFSAVQLDQNSVSSAYLIEKLSLLQVASSPTSLFFFPYVNDPLYNEERWEWLLYICNQFYLLQVLDLQGMWMTKGSLPKEIGELSQLRYLSLRGTWVTQLPQSIEDLSHLQTLDLRVWEPIIIPNVLWKLHCLMHLYLPDFIAQETAKLQLSGSSCLETLVNLRTDKVCLTDLLELKLLKKISIRNIHAMEVVDELDGILKQLSTSLDEVCINSEIINANPTVLARFQNLHNLKIKGMISWKLHPEMFPPNLEKVTMKHTKLGEDPLPVLEKLLQLRRLSLEHESYLGKEMTLSKDFYERATKLALCSLNNLETLHSPEGLGSSPSKIDFGDCGRIMKEKLPTTVNEEDEHVRTRPKTFNLSSLKKGFKSLSCC